MAWPSIEVIDETMREGMQIESAVISTADKVRILDQLSATGLRTIVVGSFVSPRWTPQMADIEQVLERFHPVPGVDYRALALNTRGAQRRAGFEPPLTPPSGADRHMLRVHLCSTFVVRNTNRTREDEIAAWPGRVAAAREVGATEAGISVNAAWGSNWLGRFTLDQRMAMLGAQYGMWAAAGIPVTKVWLGDPMGWNTPQAVAEQVAAIAARWPTIKIFHLHLHNTRGLAMLSAYAAMQELDSDKTLIVDTSIGGIGGCPYCGNGRATGMIPTEDFVHLLHQCRCETGIDLDGLIEVCALVSQVIGRPLDGRVGRAGPLPIADRLYPADLGLVETFEEAQHFRVGTTVVRRPRPNERRAPEPRSALKHRLVSP